jgi:predicted P-loop ATPase
MIKYLGAPDTEFVRAVSGMFLIAGVARILRPGCKADCVLVLEGPQGILKSTALKTLAGPWFTDELADLGTKDAAQQLSGVWIIEMSEMEGVERGQVNRIKSFVSRSVDRYRPPYGHRTIEQPRQCVFAGTVNHDEYLRDETGGRRFWPVQCTNIDIEGLASVRDQLWAEARDRYQADEAWWLNTERLQTAAAEEQRDRYQSDPWQDPICKYLLGKDEVTIEEILERELRIGIDHHGNLNPGKWSQGDKNRVARCLRHEGWDRKQVRRANGREWVYRPRLGPVTGVTTAE